MRSEIEGSNHGHTETDAHGPDSGLIEAAELRSIKYAPKAYTLKQNRPSGSAGEVLILEELQGFKVAGTSR